MESIRGCFFRGSTDRYVSERSPLKAELAVNMYPIGSMSWDWYLGMHLPPNKSAKCR